ncbi:MAG: hypothetical protein ACE5FP_10155, partial [Gemmatimonadota bacterium]
MLGLTGRRRGAACLFALILLGAAVRPDGVGGQETPADRTAEIARADSIRAAYATQRPPGNHGIDWVDVVGFPLKVVGFPMDLLLVRLPAFAIGQFTVPRPPSFIVRAFRAVGAAGVHPGVRTSIGPQSGIGIGIEVDSFDPVYIKTSFAVRGSQRHQFGILFAGERARAGAEFRWQRDAQAEFFGIGPRTPDSEVIYRREVVDIGATAGFRVSRQVSFDAGVGFEDNLVREPLSLGDETSLFEVFAPGELFGSEGRQRYVRVRAGADIDLTHQAGFQRRGVTFRVAGTAFRGVRDTGSDFHRLAFTVQGLLPLNRRQALSVRGHTQFTRPETGEVPFYHLAALGGRRTAIGFPSDRFTDLDLVALTAEWRYEIWRDIHNSSRLETFLSFGEGAVGHRLDDITGPDWHESYGLGFRMASREDLIGVLFFGFSEESFHVNVSG